jgi:iron complex outermembrane receptor protein
VLAIGLPPAVAKTPGSTKEDDTSGRAAVEWAYNDDGMVYLSFSQGYKGPGYDVTFGTDPTTLEPVDPETSESWELGLKSTWFDNRLMLNVAIFSSEYDDYQGQAFIDPDGPSGCPPDNPACNPGNETGSFALVNAGKVESEGVELDFTALLTENFRIYGGLALIDATIADYEGGPCSFGQVFRDDNGCAADSTQDLSGGDMPFSPDWKLSLTAQYTWVLPTSYDLILQSSLRAQDDILYTLSQDEYTEIDGYEIVDVSAKLLDEENRWEATFYVKNVFDEFYTTGIGALPASFMPNGYVHVVPRLSERTMGAEVRYRW